MASAKRRLIVQDDIERGYGSTTIPTDSGGTRAATKLGIHSLMGAAYLNAADQAGADLGAKINNAVAALSSAGGIIDCRGLTGSQAAASTITLSKPVHLLFGTLNLTLAASPGINITADGVAIHGDSTYGTNLITSHSTADIIRVAGVFANVSGMTLSSSVARSGGAAINQTNGVGSFERLRIGPTYYGILVGTPNAGNNSFVDISMGAGAGLGSGTWQAGIWVGGGTALYSASDTDSIASNFFTNIRITGDASFGLAMVVIEGATDTLHFSNCDFVSGSGVGGSDNDGILIRNTTSGGDHPRWIRFSNVSTEAGTTKVGWTITSAKDVRFVNCYVAGCLHGLWLKSGGGGVNGLSLVDSLVLFNQRNGVKIDVGQNVNISHSRFSMDGIATTNTYADIDIGVVSGGVTITDNDFEWTLFSGASTNKVDYAIKIASGASNYTIMHNRFTAISVASGYISDGNSALADTTGRFVGFNEPIASWTVPLQMGETRLISGYGSVGSTFADVTMGAGGTATNSGSIQWGDGSGYKLNFGYNNSGSFAVGSTLTDVGGLTLGGGLIVNGTGVLLGAATGGQKGVGTINMAADIYKNNTAFTNPDYAFEHYFTGKVKKHANKTGADKYSGLQSLAKTKAYAKKHSRLPGVHGAKGVFDRADVLLEKLEEAYLHIFELDERIKKLEQK